MKKPPKTGPQKCRDQADRMVKFWSENRQICARIGETEYTRRMMLGALKKGREIGRAEMRQAWLDALREARVKG